MQLGIPPGGLGLSGLVHEKAHPNTFCIIYGRPTFKCVDAGRIDCLLVQLVPPFDNSIRKKISSTVPRDLTLTNLTE